MPLYKNSYFYWMVIYPNANYLGNLMAVDRNRVAANAVADFVVGAATFLSATGATGGVGVAAGAWAGVKAGAKASAAVDWIGSLCGWW